MTAHTWLLEPSEIRSSCEEKIDWMIRLKQEDEGWMRERLLSCSAEMGSCKGKKVNEEERWTDEDTRSLGNWLQKSKTIGLQNPWKWRVDREFVRGNVELMWIPKEDSPVPSFLFIYAIKNGRKFVWQVCEDRTSPTFKAFLKEITEHAISNGTACNLWSGTSHYCTFELYFRTSNYSNYSEEYPMSWSCSNDSSWFKFS